METRDLSTMSIHQMVRAGRFPHGLNLFREADFPAEDDVTDIDRLEAVVFREAVTIDDAIGRLAMRGMRPGKLRGLLAFRIANPGRWIPLVALGSARSRRDGWVNLCGYRPGGCICGGMHIDTGLPVERNHLFQPTTYFLGIRP